MKASAIARESLPWHDFREEPAKLRVAMPDILENAERLACSATDGISSSGERVEGGKALDTEVSDLVDRA
jgi:hypothetical protein